MCEFTLESGRQGGGAGDEDSGTKNVSIHSISNRLMTIITIVALSASSFVLNTSIHVLSSVSFDLIIIFGLTRAKKYATDANIELEYNKVDDLYQQRAILRYNDKETEIKMR